MENASTWDQITTLTVVLASLGAIITVFGIILAIAAFWGYASLKAAAIARAEEIAVKIAEEIATERAEAVAGTVAARIASDLSLSAGDDYGQAAGEAR